MTSLPQKPTRPESMKIMRRTKANYGPKEQAEEAAYLDACKQYKQACLKVCQETDTLAMRNLLNDAHETLMDWLKLIGAPEEVLTLAGAITHAEYAFSSGNWQRSPFSAMQIVEFRQAAKPAIKSLRANIKAAKEQHDQ